MVIRRPLSHSHSHECPLCGSDGLFEESGDRHESFKCSNFNCSVSEFICNGLLCETVYTESDLKYINEHLKAELGVPDTDLDGLSEEDVFQELRRGAETNREIELVESGEKILSYLERRENGDKRQIVDGEPAAEIVSGSETNLVPWSKVVLYSVSIQNRDGPFISKVPISEYGY